MRYGKNGREAFASFPFFSYRNGGFNFYLAVSANCVVTKVS